LKTEVNKLEGNINQNIIKDLKLIEACALQITRKYI